MSWDAVTFVACAWTGACLVLAGQWCADARRRRLERDRWQRRKEAAAEGFPLVLGDGTTFTPHAPPGTTGANIRPMGPPAGRGAVKPIPADRATRLRAADRPGGADAS